MTIQRHMAMNQVQLLASDPVQVIWRHDVTTTSSQVNKTFTSITPHRISVEPWSRCHCVCLVKTHRLICNMTYLGRLSGQVIWPYLRLNFQIDLPGSKCICFDASWREEYDGVSRFFSIFLSSKFIRKKYLPKSNIFLFDLTWKGQNVTLWSKSGMVRFRTSRSFRLPLLRSSFSIRGQTSWGGHQPGAV